MSGSTAGGVVGAAIGFYAGGAQGAQIGWMIGSAVGGYVDPDVIKAQRPSTQPQTTMEGAPRAIVYGTHVVTGNLIQSGPVVNHKHTERTGKGGPVQQSYTQTISYAIRVCEGPVGAISRIWRDNKLVMDFRNPADWPEAAEAIAAMASDSAKFARGISVYLGDEDQLPDPTLESLDAAYGGGQGNVNAYRGSCYVVFVDDDVTDRGGSIPQYRFEVSSCGTSTTTTNPVSWVHGNTGTTQSIFASAIYQLTGFTAGWNNNLRRTADGGRTWTAIDYATSTGWSTSAAIEAIWHVDDITNTAGIWYMAKSDRVAISYSGGLGFTNYLTTTHTIVSRVGPGGGVHEVAGAFWAGAQETTNTVIFQPLNLGDTDIDLGADYGRATAIGDVGGGAMMIGTDAGNICRVDGTVVYDDPSNRPIRRIFNGGGIAIAVLSSGGYLTSADGGTTWTL